ncbi:MAG: nitroreductase family protein [Acidobacteriota bacterium]
MHVIDIDVDEHRTPDHAVHPLIYRRWSARAMSGEALTDDEVSSLFEAARWAPSSFNGQPWRFYYARRGDEHWDLFFSWLVEFNQGWAQNAGLLAVMASETLFEHNGEPCLTHGFDTGAAWQNLALQGSALGLVVHAMGGYDAGLARRGLGVPETVALHAMVAVGRPGAPDVLPEGLRDQEKPNQRKAIAEIAVAGLHRG